MRKKFTCLLLVHLTVGLSVFGTLGFFGFAGATAVETGITGDTVWTVAGSPYEVKGGVKVNRGVTLTIEPGVVVSFDENATLIVEGSLVAVGNSSSRIEFTSNQPSAAAGQWGGLRFAGGDNESFTVKFADVKYAENGVAIESLGKALVSESEITNNSLSGIHVIGRSNFVIQNSTIKLNGNGITAGGNISSGIQIIHNLIVSNGEDGIYFYACGADICRIFNVTISRNQISLNENGIYLFSETGTRALNTEAHINGVTIINNTVSFNRFGVRLRTHAWGDPSIFCGGFIHNSTISHNLVASNKEGLVIQSESNWYSWISGLTISNNKVLANENGISLHAFRIPQPPMETGSFDAIMCGNIVSANNNTAVSITGDVRVNLTGNSVSYNPYGFNVTSKDNVARKNDIYNNSLYGMYVKDVGAVRAQIDAEDNFWGDSTGPFHGYLNEEGQGDKVNGDGWNLDFRPWLNASVGYINQAPVARLEVSRTTVSLNQNVTINGLNSTDDTHVVGYFFDFGDGESSGWLSGPTTGHIYVSEGVYTISLIVMDEFGVRSNLSVKTLTVAIPLLDASVFLNPVFVLSQGQVLVEVTVRNVYAGEEAAEVQGALVQLSSDEGGNFNPASGFTDSNGDFNSTFSAPEVSESTSVRITVSVSKEGCEGSSESVYLSVVSPSSKSGGSDTFGLLIVAISAVVIVVALVILRKRSKLRLKRSGKRK